MMPERSGLIVFKDLKRNEQYQEIPILMLTGVSGVLEELDSHMDETFLMDLNLRQELNRWRDQP